MAQNKMQLEDWLDDLCVRFIIHLPREDLSSVARICFQVEEAHWFYEDFIRPLDPALPSMTLRAFILRIFQHCPLLAPFSADNHMRAFEEFLQYKTRVPVRGAIMLNHAMDSAVLVKGWKKNANWSFPRGKINKDEDDLDCAIREVYEETGLDIRKAGLVPKDDEVKAIDVPMREQHIRLFVFRNIPMDTVFEPKTRKEISKIEWYKLSELPTYRKKGNNPQADAETVANANKFYMVAPFLGKLHKWIALQKKKDGVRVLSNPQIAPHLGGEELLTEDDAGAQTETAAGPSNGTPAIETMEGATRELQRLLKIQPPTEGLQMSPSAAPNTGKGEALMALLQKGTEGQPQQVQQQIQQHAQQQVAQQGGQIPHTPFDHTYTNAPEPHTPHHHHPTRLSMPSYQAPPNFPIPPTSAQNASPGYYNNMGGAPSQMPPQGYGRSSFMNPAQQHRPEPVLLHPQPLPPQVQQSLLTRGIVPTPGLPDAPGQGGRPTQHGGAYQQGPQPQPGPYQQAGPNAFAPRNAGYAPQQQPGKALLNNHAMSLLNAFKNSPRDITNKPRGDSQDTASPQAHNHPQQQQQQQSAPWTNAPASQASNPAAQYLPHHLALVAPMRTPPRAMQPQMAQNGSKAAQPDSHRSALLDMFKKQGPRSPLSNEVRMAPGRAQENAGFVRKHEPGSPAYKTPSAAEAIASSSEANGAPVRMNAELNLPYRAVQILSRPKQPDSSNGQDAGAQAQMQRLQQRLDPAGPARQEPRNAGRQGGLPFPRSRSFSQQQQQMQQQHEVKKSSPQLPYAAAQAASLPYAHQQSSPSNTHAVPSSTQQQQQQKQQQSPQNPSVLLRRQSSNNPEQRQKLLSLFSKVEQQQHHQQISSPILSAHGPALSENGKGKEPAKPRFNHTAGIITYAFWHPVAALEYILDETKQSTPYLNASTL
ncbi:mRNA-decapping enzyme subunit 2 [Collariella sp. IMI 366227]|nr:mRNA-decapping enzyme subunit 2 [Collariella sp. IMI 366227]